MQLLVFVIACFLVFICVRTEERSVNIHVDGNRVVGRSKFTFSFDIFHDVDNPDANVTEGASEPQREKRAAAEQEKFYTGATCVDRLEMFKALSNNRPIQTVIHLEQGQEARLTCHYCEDKKAEDEEKKEWDAIESRYGRPVGRSNQLLKSPILWYRIAHIGIDASGTFRVEEVGPGLRDDDEENRVYVSTGHTLVIENVQAEDQGTYFCRDTTTEDRNLQMTMTYKEIKTLMTAEGTFKFIVHLNILMPLYLPPIRVPSPEAGAPVETHLKRLNLLMFTEWGRWGDCSTCGQRGERRREGRCMLKKLDMEKRMYSWYVDAVLGSQTKGVPCRSEVFRYATAQTAAHLVCCYQVRPDEFVQETCDPPCIGVGSMLSAFKKSAISPSGLRRLFFKEKKEEKKILHVNETEGNTVELKCPGTRPSDNVLWMNNSVVLPGDMLHNATDGRATVDVNGTLRISPILPQDLGLYLCVVAGKDRGHVFLNVTSFPRESDFRYYGRWVVYSFPPDLVVFAVLMWAKHRHRKRILISSAEALALSSSSSEHNMGQNATASTTVRDLSANNFYTDENNSSSRRTLTTSVWSTSSDHPLAPATIGAVD